MAYISESFSELHAFVPSPNIIQRHVQQCYDAATQNASRHGASPITGKISLEAFLAWAMDEPLSFVWLPTLHRLAATENSKHEVKCHRCQMFPIVGFRYKSTRGMKPASYCQTCFWTHNCIAASEAKEYCFQSTGGQDARDLRSRASGKKSTSRKKKQADGAMYASSANADQSFDGQFRIAASPPTQGPTSRVPDMFTRTQLSRC